MGAFGHQSLSFIKDLGRRLKYATDEPKSQQYLLQRLSVAIQRGNAASVLGSLDSQEAWNYNCKIVIIAFNYYILCAS